MISKYKFLQLTKLISTGDDFIPKSLVVLLVNGISALLMFGLHVYLARILGHSDYGNFAYAFTLLTVLSGLCVLGTDTAAQRFISEHEALSQWSLVNGFIRQAVQLTFLASVVVSIFLAMIIGLIVALPSLSDNKFLSYFNITYVEIVRAIPLLVLILWIYYGLPIMLGISFSPFVSGIIALTISESAFQAEIFRAGINSISKGQHEVSESLGMDFWKKMRLVILPQAIKVVLPAMGNQFVYVLKMSSLVSIIGIADLTRKANELVTTTYRPLEIYTFLILEYLVLILVVSYFVRKLENKLKYK